MHHGSSLTGVGQANDPSSATAPVPAGRQASAALDGQPVADNTVKPHPEPSTRRRLARPPAGSSIRGTLSSNASSHRNVSSEPPADSSLKGEALLACLPVIDEVTAHVCRRHRLSADESEDFMSEVRLHFIQREFEPLRRFEGRSSLRTYLTVVISRLFLNYRNRLWGRWRPSTEAKRLGPSGILIERLVARDGWTFDQVVTMFRVNHGETLEGPLAGFCVKVSQRLPGRQVVAEREAEGLQSSAASPDAHLLRAEHEFLAKRVQVALDRALEALEPEERLLLKMRFEERLSIADIARALHRDQKRLYRVVERVLATLGRMLEADGICREDVNRLLAD
jgi:RNA polymerase sigma factor (sigma-70 family)